MGLGKRFSAFSPLGNRERMEFEIIALAESYQWDPETVRKLPCSRRHRYLKMREMIIDSQKNQGSHEFGGNYKTGLDNKGEKGKFTQQGGGIPVGGTGIY